ncbi:MAG: HEAT repeat domain-containing protein [Cyanophyceae cyanobacterium]
MYEDAFTPLEPLDQISPQPDLAADVDVMLGQLRHPDPRARMQAARIFCDVEDPRAVELLLDLLQDPCPLVRVSASYALGRNAKPAIVAPVITALKQDWNGYVRKGLVWALGNAKDPVGLEVLVDVLERDITAVRLWAASALGQLNLAEPVLLEQGVMALTQSLERDPVAVVRSNCAWSIGQLLDRYPLESSSFDRLRRALHQVLRRAMRQDPDVGVQSDARQALDKLAAQEDLDE